MVTTDFWIEQEARFKEHEQHDDGLRADHAHSKLSGSQWRLADGFNKELRARFIEEATAAGRQLSNRADPLANWLDFLRKQKLGFETTQYLIEVAFDGSESPMVLGEIRRLWTYSAIACRRLQASHPPGPSPATKTSDNAGRPPSDLVNGEKLKAYRIAAGLTQEKLADLAIVPNASIQRGESGNGWADSTFTKVAGALSTALSQKNNRSISVSVKDLKY